MLSLPMEITNLIFEMAGVQDYWKRRFTNDVLVEINKGYRIVGWACPDHWDDDCKCALDTYVPCPNCYTSDQNLCGHGVYEPVSLAGIRKECCRDVSSPYIPIDAFVYCFVVDYSSYESLEKTLNRCNGTRDFIRERESKINARRIE